MSEHTAAQPRKSSELSQFDYTANPETGELFIVRQPVAAAEILTQREDLSDVMKCLIMRDHYGFDPHNLRERNEVLAVGAEKFPGTHLNEVLLHQMKNKVNDPPAALRAIVSDYRKYATESRAEQSILHTAHESLAEAHSFSTIDKAMDLDLGEGHRALVALERQVAIDHYIESNGETPNIYSKKITVADKMQLRRDVSAMRTHEARQRLATIIQAEHRRSLFWAEQLKSATRHGAVRAIAQRALDDLRIE